MAEPTKEEVPQGVVDAIARVTAEHVELKVTELREKAERGLIKGLLPVPGFKGSRLPKLPNQAVFDDYDPLLGRGIHAAQQMKCHLVASKSGKTVREVAESFALDGRIAPVVLKAIQEQRLEDGGAVIVPEFSSEFIPLQRAATILAELGLGVTPMISNTKIYGRQNSPAVAYYEGEVMAATASQLKVGQLKLDAKKLVCITAVSDEMAQDGGPDVDMMIRDDMTAVMGLRDELAGLRGDGTQETPLGLRNAVSSANIFDAQQAGPAATGAEIAADAGTAMRYVEESNTRQGRKLGWAFSPRTKQYLMAVMTPQGIFPFAAEMEKGLFRGYPYRVTTQIPNTLGGDGNASEMYFGYWDQYIKGERAGLFVQAYPGGTFNDTTGTLVSGITTGQIPMKAWARHDYKLRFTNCFSIITAVKYGA